MKTWKDFKPGHLVRTPISYEGHWWPTEYGIVIGYEDWGQNDVYVVVLMQKNNERCTFRPKYLERVK
jgi:hypothetical protein